MSALEALDLLLGEFVLEAEFLELLLLLVHGVGGGGVLADLHGGGLGGGDAAEAVEVAIAKRAA